LKFLYKIYSRYDGFTPQRIPDRLRAGQILRIGWQRYVDAIDTGDEIWIYFHGPHAFEPGVYIRGRVAKVNIPERTVDVRVFEHSTDSPLSDATLSAQFAQLARARGVQVFLLPEALVVTDQCTVGGVADTCKRRLCEECPVWRAFYRVEAATVRAPKELWVALAVFAPAFWAIPSRVYLGSDISPEIRKTAELFYRFKSGMGALGFPLALGMRDALRRGSAPSFDALIPIPLSPDKEAAGELNRALVLANELSLLLGVPVLRALTLAAPISKRAMRAAGASVREFERAYFDRLVVASGVLAARRVLLVDDVCTHGSTLDMATRALLDANSSLTVSASTAAQMIVTSAVVDDAPLRASAGSVSRPA
jgi:hypothetical protein